MLCEYSEYSPSLVQCRAWTAPPASGVEPPAASTTVRLIVNGTPSATPEAEPKLGRMSRRTMPLSVSTLGPFVGQGPYRDRRMDMMPTLVEHGMLLASARGPIPNVAEIVAGEPIKGSWWGHPAGHHIFGVLNDLAASPDVVRLRLVRGKVTLVHRRLWAPPVRLQG